MRYLRAYLGVLTAFLVVDLLWIKYAAGPLYQQEVGDLLIESPRALPALVFYVFYTVATVPLAVRPALELQSWKRAAVDGAILGAVAYGTLAVTNFALLEGWTATLVLTDIPWGALLTAICSVAGYFAAGRPRK